MAKKPTIATVASGYQATTTINNNLNNLRDAFDNTLSLDGSTPNAMQADLDMNSYDILNVNEITANDIILAGAGSIIPVTEVAENIGNINTVAANITSVNTTATNIAGINNVSTAINNGDLLTDVYQGARATDPTLRLDNQPLQSGDFYFNTGSTRFRTFSGGTWYDMTGGGATTAALVSYTTQAGISSNANIQLNNAESNGQALNVELRKARRTFKKLFDSATTAQQLKYISIGDSLASRFTISLIPSIDRMLNNGTNMPWVHTTGSNLNTNAGQDCSYTDLTSVTSVTNGYSFVPNGAYQLIADGGSLRLIAAGVNVSYTELRVYYIKEPGAGVIKIFNDGVEVATANAADTSSSLGILTHTKTLGTAVTLVTATGGPVKMWFAHVQRGTGGVDFYQAFNAGGITPDQFTQTTLSRSVLAAALTDISPDLITVCFDDNFGGTTYDTALGYIFSAFDTNAAIADKLFIGPQPRASDDAGRLASNERLRREISTKGGPYLFYDTYRIMGTRAEMIAVFGSDDGVHPSVGAAAFAGNAMFQVLGIDSSALGYEPRPIRSPDIASRFFRGTKVSGQLSDLTMNADTFGYDWTFDVNRSMNITAGGTVRFQISGNTAVIPNIIPANFKWDSSTDTKSIIKGTNSGNFDSIDFKDTARTKGFGVVKVEHLGFPSFTKAELPASNTRTGHIAFCSNGATDGGGALVYSRGGTNWRRVSDDVEVIP